MRNVEVYEEPYLESAQLEICEELSFMNSQEFLNDLQLHDDDLFDEHVDPIPYLELNAFVGHGQRHLGANAQSSKVQFVSQARSIGALEKARP